jgi:RNA polymerase sigma-70 factor (ECF subfamily)
MAGDADFAAFYEANYERLVVQLFAVAGNLQDAEDMVQEAFARACLRWRRLHAYGRPAAWVRRVAFHLALQGLRRARRSLGLAGRSDPAREPLRLTAEQLDLVQALGRLSLRHRQVLALHYLADLPVEEIARDLALPVGTVKSRLARARQRLAAQLTDGKEADRDHIR